MKHAYPKLKKKKKESDEIQISHRPVVHSLPFVTKIVSIREKSVYQIVMFHATSIFKELQHLKICIGTLKNSC